MPSQVRILLPAPNTIRQASSDILSLELRSSCSNRRGSIIVKSIDLYNMQRDDGIAQLVYLRVSILFPAITIYAPIAQWQSASMVRMRSRVQSSIGAPSMQEHKLHLSLMTFRSVQKLCINLFKTVQCPSMKFISISRLRWL